MHEPTFLILTVLAGGPRHGYAVMQEVASLSEDRVRLRASTLYDALDRLTADGLIEVSEEEMVGRRLRRFYRLTEAGGSALRAEVRRLRSNADLAASRLRAAGLALGWILGSGLPARVVR